MTCLTTAPSRPGISLACFSFEALWPGVSCPALEVHRRKIMKIVQNVLVIIVVLATCGCSDSPKTFIESHISNFKRGIKGDKEAEKRFFDEITFQDKLYLYPKDKETLTITPKMCAYIMIFATYEKQNFTVSKSEISGERAIVYASYKDDKGRNNAIRYVLQRERGGWKINFSELDWTGRESWANDIF